MAVNSVTNTSNVVLQPKGSANQMGQSDFLRLMTAQLSQQDPFNPVDNQQMVAQMAQFSSLEQSKTMATDMAAMRADQQRTAANSYLGHRVTVDAGKGTIAKALAAHFGLLGSPAGSGGEILIEAGLEHDIARLQNTLGRLELIVDGANGRAAVARDISRRIEALPPVPLGLHQNKAQNGLRA
eukprot:gene16367-20909_t